MLFTSNNRFSMALKFFEENPPICSICAKKMKPKHWKFGKSAPQFTFLRGVCECGGVNKRLKEITKKVLEAEKLSPCSLVD